MMVNRRVYRDKFYFMFLMRKREELREEDLLKEYPGEWLLIYNDEIIDHSTNAEEILRLAEEKFPDDKFSDDSIKILKVLSGEVRLY